MFNLFIYLYLVLLYLFEYLCLLLYLFISGLIMSIGVVVPGVSSTVILMLLGVYDLYLASVSTLQFTILIPMGLGLVMCGFLTLKIIEFLFQKFYIQTYYSIIGFVCGSVFILYEPLPLNFTGFSALLCLFFGFILSRFFDR